MTTHNVPPAIAKHTAFNAADPSPAIGLKVVRGALVPASEVDQQTLRSLNLSLGQTVYAAMDFQRVPADLKRIHKLGQLLVDQVPMFAHMDAHTAIKVLQSLSGAGCDVMSVPAGTLADLAGQSCHGDPNALVTVFQPWSLSPNTMSGAQFARLLDQLCRYVACEIWPDCNPEDVKSWADVVPPSLP
ncbi:hypothetical protein AWH63_11175 [Marinobacter sp. C18]|uniref:hypothetical protein n=1 Tax=Marinobacter sp. C18 TaxID=1772288 RepID=UPI000948E8C3|nr:hypothetical protein [Marinobacter sp. C18]OLF82094.1 hypothetical protein AWH63_11175 [Marinobacter sp. C18]